MELRSRSAEIFIPDGLSERPALARTTHLGIGAHQDDLEIMAIDGILHCFQHSDQWFTGVIVTDGAGSPRNGLYADYTDEQMRMTRIMEQKKAAVVGEFGAALMLNYSSDSVKDPHKKGPVDDLCEILTACGPEIVYTHNLADKHPTHVAVALRTIEALRMLPTSARPKRVYGCEVWRDLGWTRDEDKIIFDCSSHDNLQVALVGIFDSQVAGGKRYDLATMGRRRANATYHSSHAVDESAGVAFGMDLTPLMEDSSMDVSAFIQRYIDRFSEDVHQLLTQYS